MSGEHISGVWFNDLNSCVDRLPKSEVLGLYTVISSGDILAVLLFRTKIVHDPRKDSHLELAHFYLNVCMLSRYTQFWSDSEIFSEKSRVPPLLHPDTCWPGGARQRQLLLHPDTCWPSCTLSRYRSNTPERGPQVPKRNPRNLYQIEKNSFDLYIIPSLLKIYSVLFSTYSQLRFQKSGLDLWNMW